MTHDTVFTWDVRVFTSHDTVFTWDVRVFTSHDTVFTWEVRVFTSHDTVFTWEVRVFSTHDTLCTSNVRVFTTHPLSSTCDARSRYCLRRMSRPAKRSAKKHKDRPPLTPSQRRDELRVLLRAGWQPVPVIMERLGVSRATAYRRLNELNKTDPLESQERDGADTLWRLPSSDRDHPLRITTSEMVALALVKNALTSLAGTGLKEDLDELSSRLSHALKANDYAHWKNLDRKLFDVNEAAYDYGDKLDVVNDVITALLREERVTITQKDGAKVKFDPYTLVLYKKGLYLDGFSHRRQELRTFGIDKIADIERHVGEKFEYPASWDPRAYHRGPWGLIRGERVRVVVRFALRMGHFVSRRRFHETQTLNTLPEGHLEMTVEPDGCEEMVSWLLSFGDGVYVVEPEWLQKRVAEEHRRAAQRYE
jgi:predicted DNA-binding transcriptional regulator YafY